TDTTTLSQEIDSRLDLRIPRQGPASRWCPYRQKNCLHDATLQAFLDGVPPDDPAIRRLNSPVTSGHHHLATDTTTLSQEIDSRLDLRIPRQGPASRWCPYRQ
ncbi:DotH/IcmK family type IV secretion protein, partial [Escherichia coli]